MTPVQKQSLLFMSPGSVRVVDTPLADPQPGQVLVKAQLSAVSAGTEMLVYRGEFPDSLELDTTIQALNSRFEYPLLYGYALVGEVMDSEDARNETWINRRVFAFHPHESHFWADPGELIAVPTGLENEKAVFYPNMETAVTLSMDGAPALGEKVVVLGQGVVGLLTTALLARFPIGSLITLDHYPLRRQISSGLGVEASLDPLEPGTEQKIADLLSLDRHYQGADLVYELTGNPAALDQAVRLAGFQGRVVVGSWYGKKRAVLDLGGQFHRRRIKISSSQVSTINPELSGRWNRARRTDTAWKMLGEIQPQSWITHCLPIGQAAEAYRLLSETPEAAVQIVFTY
jgi:2-desacetyl-2-hydroxyethyl bacteriochlorophyllide A dehydrogenase